MVVLLVLLYSVTPGIDDTLDFAGISVGFSDPLR